MSLLVFIVTGVLLYLVFRVFNRISIGVISQPIVRKLLQTVIPIIELIVWIAFAFWGAYLLFGNFMYYHMIVGVMAVLLIFGLSWFLFRDFLAGVLLKSEKSLMPGQYIKTLAVQGSIQKLGSRSMEVINDSGEMIRIPYSRLSSELITLPPEDEDNLPHHMELELDTDESPDQLRAFILDQLVAMPWIVWPAPAVEMHPKDQSRVSMKVTFYTHERSQAVLVEDRLKKVLAKTTDRG